MEEKVFSGFSETLANLLVKAKETVSERKEKESLQKIRDSFLALCGQTHIAMKEFSDMILAILQNKFFAEADKAMLHEQILAHMSAVHPQTLEEYLRVLRDEEVATFCLEQFLTMKPEERELQHNDPLVWMAKRAFATVSVMDIGQLQSFCAVALEMFPGMPRGKGDDGWGFRGVLLSNANPKAEDNKPKLISADGSLVLREPIKGSMPLPESFSVEADSGTPSTPIVVKIKKRGFKALSGNPELQAIRKRLTSVN